MTRSSSFNGGSSLFTSLRRLSPLYDVVPRAQLTRTFRLALNIGVFGKDASKRNALTAAPFFGLTNSEALDHWQDVEDVVVKRWAELFLDVGLSSTEIDQFRLSIGPKE